MENYQPQNIETKWYESWEKNNYFSPDIQDRKETYTIVIPPPNVTGSLHIGHALVNTLQDVLIRWKRMSGFKTLWLPGTDHAGIATQMVVERELAKEGIRKEELGREKFIEKIWEYKEHYGGTIFRQLRRLGSSLDWKRERFTLDEKLSKAVRKTFVDFYNEGLIHRGEYLVNWCPKDKTALSDLEVDHEELEGTMTHIVYPLADGSGEIEVATTRPETMLGDTAVAVNPEDPRYKSMIGKMLKLPLVGRLIPVIADEHCDIDFGTGAVKVTPAHDPNDFAIGQRHNLPSINIFTKDAKINDVYPPLTGVSSVEARKKVVELLKEQGFWRKTEKHMHSVGHCQRCNTVVEPRISTQWFCDMKDMAKASLDAVDEGKLRFVPANQERVFREWLENIQDWCISRQIWWGHRIPAWYCGDCNEIIVSEDDEVTACPKCSSTNLTAETDVLDTWFSSGLFPFSTMGWPDKTEDLDNFYPNSTLVTGKDILFFWVARMIMMGIKLTGEVPFPEVFLHGLVRDAEGNKMSKTKGNVIDPLVIVEQFGADALRFSLASLTVNDRDVKLPEKIIEGNRNFINKFWNATRFTLHHIERLGQPKSIDEVQLGLFDKWILTRLNETAKEVGEYLTSYRFNEATKALYHFVWHEFCDWYVEILKPTLFEKLGKEAQEAALASLCHTLSGLIRLLHPLMPFVTEEIWSNLPYTDGSVMLAEFPEYQEGLDFDIAATQLIEITSAVRNIRGENNIKPNAKIELIVAGTSPELTKHIQTQEIILQALSGLKSIQIVDQFEKQEGFAGAADPNFELFVDLRESIDVEQETKRLNKEKEKLIKKAEQIEKKLANEAFVAKAPAAVVEKNQKELSEIKEKITKVEDNLRIFQK